MRRQITPFSDERWLQYCVQCAGAPDSRDHVPPRVLLDSPYPDNLPVVGTCVECNRDASLDEEYLACAIEVGRLGTCEPSELRRPKVRRILERRPALVDRLRQALNTNGEFTSMHLELRRVKRVVIKLARGHAAYECAELRVDAPRHVNMGRIDAFDARFEAPIPTGVVPELGSRAMQRFVVEGKDQWLAVQESRYRYLVTADGTVVRGVMSEYLAFEVIW